MLEVRNESLALNLKNKKKLDVNIENKSFHISHFSHLTSGIK